ncbi:MAG: hypothetical protein AB4426_12010 [Xenococcaceae cyanobacterium]
MFKLLKNAVLGTVAAMSFFLGMIFLILPGIPGFPFLLLSAACLNACLDSESEVGDEISEDEQSPLNDASVVDVSVDLQEKDGESPRIYDTVG